MTTAEKTPVVEIGLTKVGGTDCFDIKARDTERLTKADGRVTVSDLQDGEVAVTGEAFERLMAQSCKNDTPALTLAPDRTITWGSLEVSISIPCDQANVSDEAKSWLRPICVAMDDEGGTDAPNEEKDI